MKRIIILAGLLFLGAFLFAQESESFEELRLFAKSSVLKAEQFAPRGTNGKIIPGEILMDYEETPLGRLLGDLIIAEIVKSVSLSLASYSDFTHEETWLEMDGVVHVIDQLVYLQLRVIDSSNGLPLAVVEKTMEYAPLASLLTVEYYDDYSAPVLRDDNMYEPNDNVSQAVSIGVGDILELALTPGDSDWFRVELEAGLFTDDAYMTELSTSGETDTYMTVYGPDDPELFYGENDDFYDSNAGILLTVGEPGIYWIEVRGYGDDTSGYYSLESYGEAVEFADEFEPDNTWETANVIDWDREEVHAFGMGDALDVFTFELNQSGEVTIYTEGDLDTYMDIYDSYGNYISGDDDGGKDSNARIEIDLERGQYYVEVTPYDSQGGGNYSLIAERE